MKNTALIVAGIIFTLVSILQLLRYFKALQLVLGQHIIPVQWSLYAGIIAALLAIWMFIGARK